MPLIAHPFDERLARTRFRVARECGHSTSCALAAAWRFHRYVDDACLCARDHAPVSLRWSA